MRNMFSEKINNKYFKPLLKTAVVMLALMAVVVLGARLMEHNEILLRCEDLEKEIKLCEENINELEYEISLPVDEEYIERVARDKLNLSKPGEIIFYTDINS